jgi:hypothetical protein
MTLDRRHHGTPGEQERERQAGRPAPTTTILPGALLILVLSTPRFDLPPFGAHYAR